MFQFLMRYVLVMVNSACGCLRYPFLWIGLCILSRIKCILVKGLRYTLLKKDRIHAQTFIPHIFVFFFGYTLTTFPWYAASGLCVLLSVISNMTPTSHYLLALLDWIWIVSNVNNCITWWSYSIVETALEHQTAVSDTESDSKWRLFHGLAIK